MCIRDSVQGDGSDHLHEQFNLNKLERRDLELWTMMHWGIPLEQVDWIHASPECREQSLACAVNKLHRSKHGTPRTWQAHTSEKTIARLLRLLQELTDQSPMKLCTVEHPGHSTFELHPTVRHLLTLERWQLLASSHCKTASEALDGKVTKDPFCAALFPQKDTLWLTSGLPPHAFMSKCKGDCRMLVPGTAVHRLLICRPASHDMLQGQRVMKMSEDRAAIPLGAMQELWNLHMQVLNLQDDAQYECARCGGDQSSPHNPLLICDNGCKRVQHKNCSGFEYEAMLPETFFCHNCAARRRLGLD